MKFYVLALILLSTLGYLDSISSKQVQVTSPNADPIFAVCVLQPDGGSGVSGRIFIIQENGVTHIKATVYGLMQGKHGIHIHEFGNLIQGCTTAGAHYNPFNLTHGGPNNAKRHVGDCGNVVMNQGDISATLEINSTLIQLQGDTSVIGRAFVVHRDEDDLGLGNQTDSNTTGHAGPRLACGVIGRSGPFDRWYGNTAQKIDLL